MTGQFSFFQFFMIFFNFQSPNGHLMETMVNVSWSLGSNLPLRVDGFGKKLKMWPQQAIENDWSASFFSIFHDFWPFQAVSRSQIALNSKDW